MNIILILSTLISFVLSFVLLKIFIPILKSVKLGQKILDVGPRWHIAKEGTPIMGGLFFGVAALIATSLSVVIMYFDGKISDIKLLSVSILYAVLNCAIGFVDDYIKLFKKRNEGFNASEKLLLQILITVAYVIALRKIGFTTEIFIPFAGNVDFGIFYYPITVIGMAYIINCVNLTDGVDGLAGSVTEVVCIFFAVLGIVLSNNDVLTVAFPLIGAIAGYLCFNIHPAKIFMGDTGSLMLGGVLVSMATILKMPFILLLCGIVYILEGISVILQVASFKLTGKRIFKMSPIHHHFELCGWGEYKIMFVFSAVAALGSVIAYFSI